MGTLHGTASSARFVFVRIGDYAVYSNGLNVLFLAVISVFILIGGKGTKDHVAHWIAGYIPVSRLHGVGNSVRHARQEEIDHGS